MSFSISAVLCTLHRHEHEQITFFGQMIESAYNTLSAPSLLWFWEWLEFVSILVIGAGCAGEWYCDHHTFKGRVQSILSTERTTKQKWEWRFGLMVVLGLAVEGVGFTFGFLASNREIEGLRRVNSELQLKLQPRIITETQKVQFASLLENAPKHPINVNFISENGDSQNLARQIRDMLDRAKYFAETGPNNFSVSIPISGANGMYFVGNMSYVTAPDAFVEILLNHADIGMPPEYAIDLFDAFNKVGVKAIFEDGAEFIPKRETVLIIPPKPGF